MEITLNPCLIWEIFDIFTTLNLSFQEHLYFNSFENLQDLYVLLFLFLMLTFCLFLSFLLGHIAKNYFKIVGSFYCTFVL